MVDGPENHTAVVGFRSLVPEEEGLGYHGGISGDAYSV